MKKYFIPVILAAVLALVLLAACAGPAPSPTQTPAPTPAVTPQPAAEPQPIVWKMNAWMPPTGHISLPPLEWASDEIFKRSDGQLKIDIYPAFSLGFKPPTWLRDHKEGLIGISDLFVLYTAGEEPSFSVIETNSIYKNREQSIKAAHALADFKKRVLRDVWNTEMIATGFTQTMTAAVSTSKTKPISSLDDLDGLKIRVANAESGKLLASYGAIPQVMGRADIYMAMKTGVIDGFDGGWNTTFKEGMADVIGYSIAYGVSPALQEIIVVSANIWDPLPENLKQIVRDVYAEFALQTEQGAVSGKNDWADRDALENAGVKCMMLPQAEQDKLRVKALELMEARVQSWGGRAIEAWSIVKPILTEQ